MFRLLFRKFLEGRGYTRRQAKDIVAKLDWSKVREIIIKYGPTLLRIFLALLPLILEPPHTMQYAESGSEEEDYDIGVGLEMDNGEEFIVLGRGSRVAMPIQEHGIPFCNCYLNPECPVHGNFVKQGTCTLPPEGYFCSKEKGHEGPCPTYKK